MQHLRCLPTPLALYQDGLLISRVHLRSHLVCHVFSSFSAHEGGSPRNWCEWICLSVPVPNQICGRNVYTLSALESDALLDTLLRWG
jgi:hypothetical protein